MPPACNGYKPLCYNKLQTTHWGAIRCARPSNPFTGAPCLPNIPVISKAECRRRRLIVVSTCKRRRSRAQLGDWIRADYEPRRGSVEASHHQAVTSVPHTSLSSLQVRLIPDYTWNTKLKVSRASRLGRGAHCLRHHDERKPKHMKHLKHLKHLKHHGTRWLVDLLSRWLQYIKELRGKDMAGGKVKSTPIRHNSQFIMHNWFLSLSLRFNILKYDNWGDFSIKNGGNMLQNVQIVTSSWKKTPQFPFLLLTFARSKLFL